VPELPEAETIVRGLRPFLLGARIARVEVLRSDLLDARPEDFVSLLMGRVIQEVDRRGKNLILTLGTVEPTPPAKPASPRPGFKAGSAAVEGRSGPGIPDRTHLVVNLGMSGRLLLAQVEGDTRPPPSHPGIRFLLTDARVLVYDDVRRFGRLRVLDPAQYREWSRTLGPEPLSPGFTARDLCEALAASTTPVRSWLLDQRRIAGVGNIYANEALFRAGLDPRIPARRIPPEAGRRLHRALRSVLREAIGNQGTTLRDYRTPDGGEGSHLQALRVYGREALPCRSCGARVERIVFGGRSAFRCPTCQPWIGS